MNKNNIIVLFLAIIITLSGCAYHAEIIRIPDNTLYNQSLIFNNVQYVSLLRFCDYYNLGWNWDLVSQRIEVKKGNKTIVLRPGSNIALVNERPIELDHPLEYKDGTAYI